MKVWGDLTQPQRNLRLLVAFHALVYLRPFEAVFVFYFQGLNLSFTRIGVLWAVGSLAQLAADLPLSRLADAWGYPVFLRVGSFLFVLGYAGVAWGVSWPLLLVSMMIWGVGCAFVFGADVAFARQECDRSGRNYLNFSKFKMAVGYGSLTLSVLLAAGLMAWWPDTGPRVAFMIATVSAIAFAVLSWCMRSPRRIQEAPLDEPLSARRQIFCNGQVMLVALYCAWVSVLSGITYAVSQPYCVALGVQDPGVMAVITILVLYVLGFVVSPFVQWYNRWLGLERALLSLTVWFAVGSAWLAWVPGPAGLGGVVFMGIHLGLWPATTEYALTSIVPQLKATVMSVEITMFALLFALLELVQGRLLDLTTPRAFWGIITVTAVPVALALAWVLRGRVDSLLEQAERKTQAIVARLDASVDRPG